MELIVQAQGRVLIPLCSRPSEATHDSETVEMLLRRAVPTQEGIALKTSSLTGYSQLGWRLEAERPAFALLRSQFVGLAGLEPAASSLSEMDG